jgi:hypothetical protein
MLTLEAINIAPTAVWAFFVHAIVENWYVSAVPWRHLERQILPAVDMEWAFRAAAQSAKLRGRRAVARYGESTIHI